MDDRKVDVSVLCLSYNQERYIARCLDGFVNQQTDFRYEVLVHDDCSTDGTLQVIIDYERRYPNIFTVVTEEENQYSKNVNIYEDILLPIAEGQYIALCEGDDYWTDPHKLQKQYDFMENHSECSLVCHNTVVHDMSGARQDFLFNDWKQIHKLTEDEVYIDWKVHTTSYFFRKEVFHRPEYAKKYFDFADYVMLCIAKDRGEVYSLPEVMSFYNFNNPEGITVDNGTQLNKQIESTIERIEFLQDFDRATEHRHSEVIIKRMNYLMQKIPEINKQLEALEKRRQ